MKITLANPPTLHRWSYPTNEAARARHKPYYRSILDQDRRPLQGRSTMPGEHLGLQMLAAHLRHNGHEVRIVDGCVELHSSLETTLDAALDEACDLIGLTGPADVSGEVSWLAQALRRRNFGGWVVAGHDHATLNDQKILQKDSAIDAVVRGEGEGPLLALASALGAGQPLDDVPRLTWRKGGQVVRNCDGPLLDLESAPRPSRDHTERILALGMSASMFTKRGCPYRCSFCTTGQIGDALALTTSERWRRKSPRQAAAEFQDLSSRFSLEHITIVDDLFVGRDRASRAWAAEFSQYLIDEGNRTSFMIDCRLDAVEVELFALMRRAGLRRVFIGVESASPQALQSYRKSYGARPLTDAFALLDRLKIDYVLGFMFFGPFETKEGLERSARFLRSLSPDDYRLHLQVTRVYPGTRLAAQLHAAGLLRGEFPFFTCAFEDRQVSAAAEVVRTLGDRVAELLEPLPPLDSSGCRELFLRFNDHVQQLCGLADVPGAGAGWLEAAAADLATWTRHRGEEHETA